MRFSHPAELAAPQRVADRDKRFPSRHRTGVACKRLEEAASALAQADGQADVPPDWVLPGLCEAMLWSPLGLVVRPVEWKP